MPLTDTAIRNAKPAEKPTRLYDERGLYIEVSPTGGKWWRFKYRIDGREKLLSLGTYPDVPLSGRWLDEAKRKAKDVTGFLKGAREKRDEARELVAAGVDPSQARKAEKASRVAEATGSFEAVAREFHETKLGGWSESHAKRWLERMQNDVFPYLGPLPVSEITAPQLLATIRRIEARGAIDTTRKALEACGQVLRYGIGTGRCKTDVSHKLSELLKPGVTHHYAAIVNPTDVGALLRSIAAYRGSPGVRAALQLAPLVFQRPGNLRMMEWAELNLDGAVWTISAAKMKGSRQQKVSPVPHVVPLSTQAVAILRDIQPVTGHGRFVFPGQRDHDQPMSDAALNSALDRLGYPREVMRAHGFRAMARTLLAERLGVDETVIEAQLAHAVRDSLGRAYNRTQFMDQRRATMQAWADYLDQLRDGTEVIPLKAA